MYPDQRLYRGIAPRPVGDHNRPVDLLHRLPFQQPTKEDINSFLRHFSPDTDREKSEAAGDEGE
jgi:hypothetical protein